MSAPPPSSTTITAPLVPGMPRKSRLRSGAGNKRAEHLLTLTPQEIVVEHGALLEPLRFAPGSVAVATAEPGSGKIGKDASGRFAILRRLSATAVVPRSEGIEGWVWTSAEGSALTVLTDQAPNVLFIFSPPLPHEKIATCFDEDLMGEIAKRSPLGEPALFGLLLRAEKVSGLDRAFERYGFRSDVTDREVPPTQRRHLADDKSANPSMGAVNADRAKTSMPPPGGA